MFFQNSLIIWCNKTKEAAIVDPGGKIDQINLIIHNNNLHPKKILLTHGHIDHVYGAYELSNKLKIPIYGPQKNDNFWLKNLPEQSKFFNLEETIKPLVPDQWLEENDIIKIGHVKLEVFHCPGHSPGHIIFFYREGNLLLSGDTIFNNSIGRTDFPLSNYSQLIHSIREKILKLDDQVLFIPGHGATSTVGIERFNNPFLN